jgi:hypothetical protein
MKIFYYLFLINISLFYIGCGQEGKTSEIKVGMTYNEVEAILDKPISISRGANELYSDVDDVPYETLMKLNLENSKNINDSSRWIAPQNVRTIGNLIYVTWIYDKTSIDTFYIVMNTYKEVQDTMRNNIPIYYLGTRKVSQSEYTKSDGYEYRLHDNKIVDKSLYNAYKKSGLYKLPDPKKIEKRIEYKTNISVISSEVRDSTERKYYVVEYKYCVVFDASSGRVTNSGYFPFYVSQISYKGS